MSSRLHLPCLGLTLLLIKGQSGRLLDDLTDFAVVVKVRVSHQHLILSTWTMKITSCHILSRAAHDPDELTSIGVVDTGHLEHACAEDICRTCV